MASASPTFDLTTTAGVVAYLAATPFDTKSVDTLSGGNANFTFRLRLRTLYKGQTTLVLKHSQSYVKVHPDVPIDLERQKFEVEAMRRVKSYLPHNAFVTVPEVYHFDEKEHVIIMEDCGEDSLTLKAYVQQGHMTSLTLAEKVGAEIAGFAATLHNWSRGDEDARRFFGGNDKVKGVVAWYVYGRLLDTVPKESQKELRALKDQPVEVSEADFEVVKEIVEECTASIMAANELIAMGDFWPGNVVVALDAEKGIRRAFVVDWETVRLGIPGDELGQFSAEIDLLRRFYPESKEYMDLLLSAFFATYRSMCTPSVDLARRTLIRWATHIVGLVPRIEWGGDEKTRETFKDGVELLVQSKKADEAWLAGSFVGCLM